MPVGALFRACNNLPPFANMPQREITMYRFQLFFHLILALVAGTGLSEQAAAQGNQFTGVELSIEPVAGNVYMVKRPGGGGNIGAFTGPDGVLLVDSLFAPLSDRLVAAVREVTDSEIRFLVNTHIHPDHVGGNENLAELGVLIFAHDNTRLRFLEEKSHFPRQGGSFVPQPPVAGRPVIKIGRASCRERV